MLMEVMSTRDAAAVAARDETSGIHHKSEEEEKGNPNGAKAASWLFVSTVSSSPAAAAASVHPIEEEEEEEEIDGGVNNLPFFYDNDLPSFHIKRLRQLRFRVAATANRNCGNNFSLKPPPQQNTTKEVEFSRSCSSGTTMEDSAVRGDGTVAPFFAHDPRSSSEDETRASSHVHSSEEEEEEQQQQQQQDSAMEVPTRDDVSMVPQHPKDPDEEEESSLNKQDKSVAADDDDDDDDDDFPVGHYYKAQCNGDVRPEHPSDSDDISSQGRDSVSSLAMMIHTRIIGEGGEYYSSSKLLRNRSSSVSSDVVSDVLYPDPPPSYVVASRIPSSRSIGYSSSILAAYSSGSLLYPGAPNHSGSISHRSDSSAASNRSFAFPIFATDGNSSPVRMAQPDRRYLRRKKWRWRTASCACCSRASPTYY